MTSKAENGFAIIRERALEEMKKSFMLACEYITHDCGFCPLENNEQCVKKCMPPALADVDDDRSICADWISLHFRQGDKP